LELTHCGKDCIPENIGGHAAYSCSSFITVAEEIRAKQLGRAPIPTIEMTREKIRETVEKYANAAMYCKQAGMKMCLIHGAHGNLIAQFASPYFNKRADEYGGSLENRARFAVELLDAIRAKVGEDFVIEYRISAEEFHPQQMHFDETLKFIAYIKDKIDILHVSAGLHDVWGEPHYMRYLFQNYTMDQMYNVHFAADIKKAYPGLLVATVGSIKDIAMAEEIIASGKADIVCMNRALHADPEMLRKYAEGREYEHTPCLRCSCGGNGRTQSMCAVNPIWGMYEEYPEGSVPLAKKKKKVAVIGGGPAGIEAVKWLIERGHDVTIYEKGDRFGGNVLNAVAAPFKKDLKDYLAYMEAYIDHAPARKLLNTEATPEMIKAENYDAVILAVGADPIIPNLPGCDRPNVFWAPDAENGRVECGKNVVIIGASSVGTEASINLAQHGKNVTVLDMADKVSLRSTGAEYDLMQMSAEYGVKRLLGWKLREIKDGCVTAEDVNTGELKDFAADTVLLAVGMKPRQKEALRYYHTCPETNFFMVGDCAGGGDIRDAVKTAFDAARYI
jgi:2,4-dienoyl-CoA reductase-like NADH-dependent reductase (Old Yellow Enzyme family)/thioredoxin reductase